ncbi:unnamed protein product [Rotaria sp. Silwood2]|nr:unnamed protein product [Rotaria sp. Silwood2]CAF2589581.1 unnamed protein product [Rotaria sp. Silwood2]CAF2854066.1 unnamed protein product [Rotaria sp. Silwood2]CAF3001513.1 unnamed protein product [Rotaria sp. Silwood2]CAF4277572.1 unnamed protein product [Rotaria sp. Silwood2]
MKHVDVWYDVALRQNSLALILEDDPLFVPFFKEKLNRLIYTAIRTGALRVNGTCVAPSSNQPMAVDEWINQEPMFVLGACFNLHDNQSFRADQWKATPVLSTQKLRVSRCAHAYIITACTAQAMVSALNEQYTEIDTPDFLMNHIFPKSSLLQSFWIDPPLVYQGNRVDHDIDQLQTFKETKYNLPL